LATGARLQRWAAHSKGLEKNPSLIRPYPVRPCDSLRRWKSFIDVALNETQPDTLPTRLVSAFLLDGLALYLWNTYHGRTSMLELSGLSARLSAFAPPLSRLELSIVSPELLDGWPFYGANISAKMDKTFACASWLIIPRFLTNRDLSTVLSWSRTTWPCLPLKEQLTLVG